MSTTGILFHSDASINVDVFGDLGQHFRVVRDVASIDLVADTAARTIESLSRRAMGNLTLTYAFSNLNSAALPVKFEAAPSVGFGFASVSDGLGSRVQVRSSNPALVETVVADAVLGSGDLLLTELTMQGKVYILALRSESFGVEGVATSTPDVNRFWDSIRSFKNDLTELTPFVIRPPCE